MREQVEKLKSCGICEICVVGMSTQEFVSVCSILESQVCREVPEST